MAQLELVLMKNEPNSNSVSRSVEKKAVPRTCREGRANDPSLPSGMYWIDPDGQGVGDDPIYVNCDMIKGIAFFFLLGEIHYLFVFRIHACSS